MKKKISEIRANKGFLGTNTASLAGEFLHFHEELKSLKGHYKYITAEQVRWYLVPTVTICESFYKEIFAKYIDSSEVYLDRIHTKDKPQVTLDDLIGISKKTFTIGELYAYTLKYNSISEIRKNYEIICGCDYVSKIETFNHSLRKADESEVARVKKNVKQIFK